MNYIVRTFLFWPIWCRCSCSYVTSHMLQWTVVTPNKTELREHKDGNSASDGSQSLFGPLKFINKKNTVIKSRKYFHFYSKFKIYKFAKLVHSSKMQPFNQSCIMLLSSWIPTLYLGTINRFEIKMRLITLIN